MITAAHHERRFAGLRQARLFGEDGVEDDSLPAFTFPPDPEMTAEPIRQDVAALLIGGDGKSNSRRT